MSELQRRYAWPSIAFAIAMCTVAYPAAADKDTGSVKEAGQNLKDEDPKALLITLKNAIRKSPQDPAAHLEIARLYFQLGDAASAEREARAARDLKGDEAEYLPVLLDAMLARKEFKEIYDLIEPGDRNPVLESKVRTALGTAAVRQGYDTRAEALLRDAIKLDGDTNLALSSNKLAHQLAPDATPIRSAYIALLKQAKYLRETRDVLKEAMIREPQNASLKADLIRADAEIDGVDAAVSKAREAAASDPDNSIHDVVSAELYEKAGRGEEAVSLLENAVASRPSGKTSRLLLPAFTFVWAWPAKAESFLQTRLQVDPNYLAARSELAFYFAGQKKNAAAIAEYSHLVEDHPADPTALNNLACLYQRQGELGMARELAQRAFGISPGDAHYRRYSRVDLGGARGSRDGLDVPQRGQSAGTGRLECPIPPRRGPPSRRSRSRCSCYA